MDINKKKDKPAEFLAGSSQLRSYSDPVVVLLLLIIEAITFAKCNNVDKNTADYVNSIFEGIDSNDLNNLTDFFNEASETVDDSNEKKECGWNIPDIMSFEPQSLGQSSPIARYGDFPWMIALMKKTDDSDVWSQADYLGGGVLIHPSAVITAAHKFTVRHKKLEAHQIKCRAGEYDTQSTLEPYKTQERDVSRYFIHEAFERPPVYNDIALIILEKPFNLGVRHIRTSCLAKELPVDYQDCYSMGWGKDFNDKKKNAVILKKVKLKFVEHDRCQRILIEKTRFGWGGPNTFKLHESLTCANGEEGVDTCRGDGGSPLVCPVATNGNKTRYAVYGLVAFGFACDKPAIPGVYVNVPHLRSWVVQKMQEEGYDDTYFTI